MDGTVFGLSKDLFYMDKALQEARKALELGEVPVGAVIVNPTGEIVATGHNRVETIHCQTGHAELQAIQQATSKAGNWRLDWHWIYVTLEPCLMCLGCIQLSRFAGVVYGAPAVSQSALDINHSSWLYNKNNFVIISQIRAAESINLLQEFFQRKRK
jgi:tRNA(adenine34) deaminase